MPDIRNMVISFRHDIAFVSVELSLCFQSLDREQFSWGCCYAVAKVYAEVKEAVAMEILGNRPISKFYMNELLTGVVPIE